MGRGVFVTGTDTGVGKTLVACGLACSLRDRGYAVGVMKPAETGCGQKEGGLFPQDAFYLRQASGCDHPLDLICPYMLPLPLAPSAAAAAAGIQIDPSLLWQRYNELSGSKDLTLVEGAGGLLVPLLPHYSYADLARSLDLSLIVVVSNRLGALNHALLTLEHAACLGLQVLGYFLNDMEGQLSPASEANAETLQFLTQIPCLGKIPHLPTRSLDGTPPEGDLSRLSSVFRTSIDIRPLEALLPHRTPGS
ncbi:MAG: dethiobiotin synthase [Candidatus Binatia bacterium]|jgi:dethiobiotin synthetase|nr:dethiobiotin synthase [Candidatus Binatia bacterium]